MTRLRGLALLSVVILATAMCSWAGVFVSVAIGPPALPVYAQPIGPGPGYIWTPGYWAWGPDGYYWVPGTWVLPPQVGLLWTPGYWGFSAGLYNWHPGYWASTVGFYGGINYGFGYTGSGYWGGYWRGRDFYYNRAVNNVNITNVHNVYNRTVVNNVNVNRVSYNGGRGGIQARPMSTQLAAEQQRHLALTSAQVQHEQLARNDRAQLATENHGKPAVVATPRPGALSSREATRASQPAVNRPTANSNASNNARQVPRPPQNNQQARASENVPRPQRNNHSQQQASANIPRPPSNQQQARGSENAPRPGNNVHQPTQPARNVPHPATTQHVAAPPQQQARHASNPPHQTAPQYRAAARPPAPSVNQRPPSQHQTQQPRQTAAHQAPAQRGQEQKRPH